MNNMIKQMRVKFSGIEDGNDPKTSRDRDRKLTPQKSLSYKGDQSRSRGQNWYRGQSSRELTYDYDSDYMESDEFQTAVAAAAYAINASVEEERKRARRRREESLSKPKKKQEGGAVSVTTRARERIPSSSSSGRNKMKTKEDDDNVPISTPSFLSKRFSDLKEKMPPQRAHSPANTTEPKEPSFKRSSSSFDKQSSDKRSPESSFASSSRQTPTRQPTFPATNVDRKRAEPRIEETKADVWEQTELERIQERYEKVNAKILEWENEKKEKAKKKLSRNKDESGKKRARALQSYKTDMEMIDQIAQGARSQAAENRRKEIIKVKEKANNIRLTGKIPTKTCLCF
uniref:uncharacterized protein At3g61260-like n=1 Tax=Erigeron canadensis TaxID=72917 RepID=UPI001CB913BC|nr:uncharacterized protein At3g61260-like [Erigeron canadensis]